MSINEAANNAQKVNGLMPNKVPGALVIDDELFDEILGFATCFTISADVNILGIVIVGICFASND